MTHRLADRGALPGTGVVLRAGQVGHCRLQQVQLAEQIPEGLYLLPQGTPGRIGRGLALGHGGGPDGRGRGAQDGTQEEEEEEEGRGHICSQGDPVMTSPRSIC